jgi:hypothetical protein
MTAPSGRASRTTGWLLSTGAVAALTATAIAADPVGQAHKVREEVIQSSVKAPQDPQPSRDELQRAIERLQNMQLAPRPAPAETTSTKLPPDLVESVLGSNNSSAQPAAKPAAPAIPDSVIEEMKRLPTDQIADMTALADALYLGERQNEAFAFYEKALANSTKPDTKAWALFQMANCRRHTDAAAAQTLYKRLTAEYPKCPWVSLAQTQQQVLALYQSAGLVKEAAAAAGTAAAGSPNTSPAKGGTSAASDKAADSPATEKAASPESEKAASPAAEKVDTPAPETTTPARKTSSVLKSGNS